MKRAKIKIEPFVIELEKLQELNSILADPKLSEIRKTSHMRQIGVCLVCRKMATQIVKYRMFGVTKIEKYCSECLQRYIDNEKK